MHGGRVRLSRCRIEPGRHVERHDRRPRRIGPQHEIGVASVRRPRDADAEQPVDDQSGIRGRRLDRGGAARVHETTMGRGGVGGKALGIACEHDVHVLEMFAQHARHDECVAAVVARAREHDDGAPALAGKPQRRIRRRGAGTLHEAGIRVRALHLAQLRNRQDGRQCRCHGWIIVARAAPLGCAHGQCRGSPLH
jgi:hypothetical protein